MLQIKGMPNWLTSSIVISFNALSFGLDTGTIGPVTTMPSFIQTFGQFSAIIHGVIVSTILLTGLITSLFSGVLADRHGRRKIIGIGSLVFAIGAILETTAVTLSMFIIGRSIKGIGEGLFLSSVYVLLAESAPTKQRGMATNLAQLTISAGVVMGFFISYGTQNISGELSWRLPLAIQAAIALLNAVASLIMPESPRWLLATGRTDQARKILIELDIPAEDRDALLNQPLAGLQHTLEVTFIQSIREMLSQFASTFAPSVRSRTLFGFYLLSSQQLAGIDGVLYYAPLLFAQAGLASTQASFLASGVSALVMLVVTIPATLYFERWGRKTASVYGGAAIFGLMLLIGSLYAADQVHADRGAARWVVIVSIYLYAIVFSATWAMSLRTYMMESLPSKVRGPASSLAQSTNWMANYIVALTTPVFLSTSSFGAYYFFGFWTLGCTLCCAAFMVETKGHSLEAIEQRYEEQQQQEQYDISRTGATFNLSGLRTRIGKLRHIRS